MRANVCSVFQLPFLIFGSALAQPQTPQGAASALGSCQGKVLTEYTIGSAKVVDPFWILRWRKLDPAVLAAVTALQGKSYSFTTVNAVSTQIESQGWLPDTPDTRVNIAYSDISVQNCSDTDKKLDVAFVIFSARISATLSTFYEWRNSQATAPQAAAGLDKADAPVQVAPEAGFEPGRGFYGGGMARIPFQSGGIFRVLEMQGTGSSKSRNLAATLVGSYDSPVALLSHAEWRLAYVDSRNPVFLNAQIGQSKLVGQVLGATRPLSGLVLRFGGSLEGGTLQSDLAVAGASNSHYTSLKLFSGATGNWRNQALAASFGLGLGATGNDFAGSWRKLLGDVSHQLWLPVGSYRFLEVEQHLNAGGIQNVGTVPLAARFYGGNRDTPFILGSDWTIGAGPVVRSIPSNRFYASAAGFGGDRFFAYNSTTALTVWGKPVVPPELLQGTDFLTLLNSQVDSQAGVLGVYYESKDVHFLAAWNARDALTVALAQVKAAADALQAAAPAALLPEFKACAAAIAMPAGALRRAKNDKPIKGVGLVPEFLPGGIYPLEAVVTACGTELVNKLAAVSIPAPALASAAKTLADVASGIVSNVRAINKTQAETKAKNDLAYVRRTLDIITKQMTITSISPVFVFDVARMSPQAGGISAGNRYGVGGGVRFTLVSTVSFTAGYAVNVRARPGEGAGAFFFSLGTRNLFQ